MTEEKQLVSINIREENGKQTVSARELHEKLEVKSKFMDWFNNMLKYGFEENVDYVLASIKKETNNLKNPGMAYKKLYVKIVK